MEKTESILSRREQIVIFEKNKNLKLNNIFKIFEIRGR